MNQNRLKVQGKHKVGKRRPPDTDFLRFFAILGVPRGAQKCKKTKKMPSKNGLKKRRQKRRRPHPLLVECGGLRAASRNARFLLRKVFAMILDTSLPTPPLPAECGGFCLDSWGEFTERQHSRRSAADFVRIREDRRTPLNSWQ